MSPSQAPSGGKAEASGSNYENLVAAWYCTRVLLGRAAQPGFDLPASTRLVAASFQTFEPVDDVNCETSDRGTIFVQAKRSVTLSARHDSALASAIDQFVRQQKERSDAAASDASVRPLDILRDRLVLTTRSPRSSKITQVLPRLLRGLRDRPNLSDLSQVATSNEERQVAQAVEKHLRRGWCEAYGHGPSPVEIGGLLRFVWVQTLDVEADERDRDQALDLSLGAIR